MVAAMVVAMVVGLFLGGQAAAESVVWLGDSLGSGYLLKSGESPLPQRLEQTLAEQGCRIAMTNDSLAGAQTAWGLSRIEGIVQSRPDVLLLELGANDALTMREPSQTKKNLALIIARAQQADIKVILLAVKAPRNWSREYIEQFDGLFPDLAREHNIVLFPQFILEFVWNKPQFMQPDGLHPNAEGGAEIATHLAPFLRQHLECF